MKATAAKVLLTQSVKHNMNRLTRLTMADKSEIKVPVILGTRPGKLAPALREWRRRNPYIDWTVLVKRGLKRELAAAGLNGKRFGKLLALEVAP